MCTLTTFRKQNSWIITHNRDEHISREPALPPAIQNLNNRKIVFPRDGRAGGTWIAAQSDRVICLLNGASTKHIPAYPYRKSRGLVLINSFEYPDFHDFSEQYNLNGIEPFTMVSLKRGSEAEIIRWNGIAPELLIAENFPFMLCSATLYTPDEIYSRTRVFNNFLLRHSNPDAEAILELHLTASAGDPSIDFCITRPNGVKTLSISQIEMNENGIVFNYLDLFNSKGTRLNLKS